MLTFSVVDKVFEVVKRYYGQQLREYRTSCIHNENLKK